MARQMKDSGIEWIGEIPVEWRTCKIKDIFQVVSGATPKSEHTEYWDGNIAWVTPADYKTNDKYVSFGKRTITQAGYDSCGTTIVPAGSIVFSKRAPIGSVAIAQVPLCTNQGCLSCINKSNADTTFFYYVMSIFTEIFELFGSGTTFKELSYDSFAAFTMPNPPLPTQRRIAAFLDSKCAEIDAVIERTKATIEEYKKLKQAVITEAVTKGIRGARNMKDSGIEWIGEIPEEWDCTKLKQVWISVDSGVSVNAADYPTENDTQYGVLKTSCVSKFVFLPNEHKQVDADEYVRVACPVKKDTIIVSRMNTPDLVGACGYVDAAYHNLFLPDRLWQISFYPNVITKYVWYYLNNQMVRAYISSLSTGTSSSMQNISKPQFGGIPLAVPAIEEQNEIITYLDEKCAALDTLIAKKTALLTELETYKKSLIYEYVTGKKEVL